MTTMAVGAASVQRKIGDICKQAQLFIKVDLQCGSLKQLFSRFVAELLEEARRFIIEKVAECVEQLIVFDQKKADKSLEEALASIKDSISQVMQINQSYSSKIKQIV